MAGADWSLEALRRCRRAAPAAPVAVMDLGALGIRAGAVDTYLSLGVVEHDPAGPGRILDEARRALAPGGRLLLSVPYLNGVRRLFRPWLARRQARVRQAGGEFYQYAFTRAELRGLLDSRGFLTLSLTPYDPARLLRKAWERFRRRRPERDDSRAGERAGAGSASGDSGRSSASRLARAILYTEPALRLLGHMILAVAVKR